jgi:hypothetical protein
MEFSKMTEPQIAKKVLNNIFKPRHAIVENYTSKNYKAFVNEGILHNEEIYLDQAHEKERLLEQDMFYKERRAYKQ